MKRYIRLLAVVLMVTALLFMEGGPTALAEEERIGYSIRPSFPENQIDPQAGYYYLRMKPGQVQQIKATIVNRNDEEILVSVSANTAFTNANGLIEYNPSTQRDESMEVDFAQLVAVPEPIIKVPAHSLVEVPVTLTMPETPFVGEVLGGLVFIKQPKVEEDLPFNEEQSRPAEGIAIRNLFGYSIAIRLRETDEVIAPDFQLTGAAVTDRNGRPALALGLRNPQPVIIKHADLTVRVVGKAGQVVWTFDDLTPSFAPNSAADYRIWLVEKLPLAPGEYQVEADLTYNGESWQLSTPLTIE